MNNKLIKKLLKNGMVLALLLTISVNTNLTINDINSDSLNEYGIELLHNKVYTQ